MSAKSGLGSVIVGIGVLGIAWLGLRQMAAKQKAAFGDFAQLGVVVVSDGVDVTLDGAPVCRDGERRWVGRAPSGEAGSFDEPALVACIKTAKPARKTVATISRASSVPSTFEGSLATALKRAGVDVVR